MWGCRSRRKHRLRSARPRFASVTGAPPPVRSSWLWRAGGREYRLPCVEPLLGGVRGQGTVGRKLDPRRLRVLANRAELEDPEGFCRLALELDPGHLVDGDVL